MKKRSIIASSLLIPAALSLLLTACGGGGATNTSAPKDDKSAAKKSDGSSAPIVIKFTHVVDDNSPKGKAANLFRDLVKERLGGKVSVEVYPNSQLYNDAEGVEALQAGNIQMMAPSNSQLIGLEKSFQIYMLPYLFKNTDAVLKFNESDIGKKLLAKTEKYHIKVLATWSGGYMQISNNVRPIEKPQDLKGIKMRVMSGGILSDQYTQFGAGATVIPFSETYMALQQGTVDGQENPYNNTETQKINEVQKYMTETNHAPATYQLIVNSDFWNGLPADVRTELEKIVKEVTQKEIAWTDQMNDESKKKIIDAGKTKINVLTDEQRKAFIDAYQPLYKKYEEIIGKDAIDFAKSLNK